MLRAEEVSLKYASGGKVSYAVDRASLQVPTGSFVGVIGPSGSGKSSLLYVLSGLKRPTSGRVIFDGISYADTPTWQLIHLRRERFGFVFQQNFLINYLNVLENVMVGAPIRDEAIVRRARLLLERVGLENKLRQRPYQLSIGERQRVAVVRALVHKPQLVFADEPTAALDQATGKHVISLLVAFRRDEGGSVVVVTHDSAMLSDADDVLQLHDGRLN